MIHPQNRRVRAPQIDPSVFEEEPTPRGPSRLGPVWAALRWALGVALVVGISVGAAYGVRNYVMTAKRFALTEVVVKGAEHETKERLLAQAKVELGANIFALDLEAMRLRLLEDPWIAKAEWLRLLPGTLELHVTERHAVAMASLPELFLLNDQGEPFKRYELGDPSDLPLITGLSSTMAVSDRGAFVELAKRAIDLLAEYDRSPLATRLPTQSVEVSDDGRLAMTVGKKALSLEFGQGPYRRKIDEARRVVAELDKRGAEAGAILLDNEARPERVVVRLR